MGLQINFMRKYYDVGGSGCSSGIVVAVTAPTTTILMDSLPFYSSSLSSSSLAAIAVCSTLSRLGGCGPWHIYTVIAAVAATVTG